MRWLILIFVVHVAKVRCEEPQCSKFHYEVQTLEKMIRMEVKQEATEKEIMKTNQLVLNSLRTLTSERENAKTERADFNKEYSDLKKSILEEVKVMKEEFNTDYADLKKSILEEVKVMKEEFNTDYADLKKSIQKEVEEIRGNLITPSVTFKARGAADLSLATGQTVVFSTIMMNEGGAYDNTTGIFTVPVAGTYLFTIHICMPNGIGFCYGLVYDNIVYTSGTFADADYYKCYTADAILVLKTGQKVWLKCLCGGTSNQLYEETSGSYNRWNTFSGVLIHK